ncbi:hypothetical protein AD953_03195 [Acetobacter malorum]|uniref:Uncharacterized protein n=1 Tax=Acetobacter malorum TaxID=178901 RepID=A0A149VG58_9PROT|nr:hypothetical protein [Acetobacter malorum]KXV79175.1 hypothetical protein AD953_03195 [Acetobacter malorum]
MKEIIQGRRLGSSERVEFEYDESETNIVRKSGSSCESNLTTHAVRIYPDVPIVVAPARKRVGGVVDGEKIVLFTDSLGRHQQTNLFHELWHHAEKRAISAGDLETVYKEVSDGDDWSCDYLNEPRERAARAFEHYASARASGLQLTPARKGTAQHIFERLYEGTEHAAMMKRRRREKWESVMSWVRPIAAMAAAMAGVFGIPHFLF